MHMMTPSARLKTEPAVAEGEPATVRTRTADTMGGFAKGLAVIEAFGQGEASLTIAEIARRAGLDRAATRRCLLTLVSKGYVTSQGRYFSLAPRILRLAHAFLAAPLATVLQPSLEALALQLNESCSAASLDGTRIMYVARSTLRNPLTMSLDVGSRLPAFCTAAGRVLLAALPPQEARQVLLQSKRAALTEHTITDVDKLLTELTAVRNNGYALIDEELQLGARSIAVPLFNVAGRIVAALTVGTSVSRASLARLRTEVLVCLRQSQGQLAEILV